VAAPTTNAMTTGSLAALLKAELRGPADIVLSAAEAIDLAEAGEITFIRSVPFAAKWGASRASAALVTRGIDVPGHDAGKRALLIVPDADAAMIQILTALAPAAPPVHPGIHPSAVIDPAAKIDATASVGPLCVVGSGSVIGAGAVLKNSVSIGAQVRIGSGTVLHPGVAVGDRCTVGASCILHPGVVIGADGFGYAPGSTGAIKIPHIGNVEVGSHVEIGANSCIDRAKFGSTSIGDGTKIDNLVQIAHNCRIGRSCLICGHCGLSGSVTLGDGVILAGGVGIADNVTIGAGARVGASAGVMGDIPAGETWYGLPAMPGRDAARNYAAFRELANNLRELRRLHRAESSEP